MLLDLAAELQVDGPLSPAEIPAAEWTALWRRSSRASVFQSPAWIHAWWAHFGGSHPWFLAFRDGERLAGVAPIFLWPEERRVLLAGTGITDSLDILAEHQFQSAVAGATLQWLEHARSEWDVCDWQQLPSDSPLRTASLPSLWEEILEEQDATPTMRLPASIDEMPRAAELAYLKRRLSKEGDVEFLSATAENLGELLEHLGALHTARWEQRKENGVLAGAQIRDFHRDAARGLLRLGALRLFVLKMNGQPVAAYYGFHHARRAVYYLGGFDPEWKRFSVGTLVIGHAIKTAIREGATEFDFGRGREPYKYRWGARDRINYRREVRQ